MGAALGRGRLVNLVEALLRPDRLLLDVLDALGVADVVRFLAPLGVLALVHFVIFEFFNTA